SLKRINDGYFAGANFPIDPKLAAEETDFDPKNMSISSNARRVRWDELMKQYKGSIDPVTGQLFLSDHYDTFAKERAPSERTLCGHVDKSPRGMKPWQPAYGTAGVAQAKITDAALAAHMSMFAALGHSCGLGFSAAAHFAAPPAF